MEIGSQLMKNHVSKITVGHLNEDLDSRETFHIYFQIVSTVCEQLNIGPRNKIHEDGLIDKEQPQTICNPPIGIIIIIDIVLLILKIFQFGASNCRAHSCNNKLTGFLVRFNIFSVEFSPDSQRGFLAILGENRLQ